MITLNFYVGIFILTIFLLLLYEMICEVYYHSQSFGKLQERVSKEVNDIQELKDYIAFQTRAFSGICMTEYGQNKPKNVCDCSLSVLRNAKNAPFKYICKYFNIPINRETQNIFEEMINQISSIEETYLLVTEEKKILAEIIRANAPWYISTKSVLKKIGVSEINYPKISYPTYTFFYQSPGGRKTDSFSLVFNRENLEKFIEYLNGVLNRKESASVQRALMTKQLREKIKRRDKYTCQICGNSIQKEPNLLLEIDHIIPISKGGLTVEENLQTLCWKCNRRKSNKI